MDRIQKSAVFGAALLAAVNVGGCASQPAASPHLDTYETVTSAATAQPRVPVAPPRTEVDRCARAPSSEERAAGAFDPACPSAGERAMEAASWILAPVIVPVAAIWEFLIRPILKP